MVDDLHWRCNLCSKGGKFHGNVNTISQHVKGGDHVNARKNHSFVGGERGQLMIQVALAKRAASGKSEYPSNYVPTVI
jgi:hypothetical protein